ncbi:alpha/beta hydrolase [Actinomadura sp. WMMB 499]|uniref:alpha/beta hydrolase n=1 Tax=Actinomadura sp. WMMB 499 TaxID=1219491 RepID=UPI0012478F36|nr:alpha/beta hydrolase [Actinomadura sp. WMMB 499]QFG23744.1 alpha/beta hydrolase [Actinomadura sp. WMMB 499]
MLRKNRRVRWAAGAAAGLVLAGGGVPLAGRPAEAAPAPPVPHVPPPITWTACGDDGNARCGTLTLPVDRDEPDGATFGLAVARRPALDPGARIGTLVFGPGGPGDSGVHQILEGDRFSDALRRHFDIVSFDPRGVGGSAPITCARDLVRAQPSPVMADQDDFDATVAHNERLRADCAERTGPIYGNADTLSTVRDLDALREALGESRLTFHGSSYGTLLGEQYAETYPHRVRAMVLESVVDHSRRGAGAFLTSQAAAAQDSFDEFVEWCDRTDACALHGRDVRAVWQGLLDRARRGDLPGMSEVSLVEEAYSAFYGPRWAELARTLAALDAGDPPPATSTPRTAEPTAGPSDEATVQDPFLGVFCSDWSLPVRDHRHWSRLMRRVERVAPDMTYTRPVRAAAGCIGAPRPVANPQHRLDVRGLRTPILLSNARHDPASGHNWATNVARQLGREGVLLTYEGAGHGSYNRSDCMRRTIDRYLIDLDVPARGTTCPPVPAGSAA